MKPGVLVSFPANTWKRDIMAEYQTLGALLERHAATYAEKTYLYWKDEEVSYAEFNRRVNQVANGLLAAGVHQGEKVALLLANCPEFLYAFFACARVGAVVVPVNPQLKAEEVQYILNNCEAGVLLAAPQFASLIGAIASHCPALRTTWYTGVQNDGSRRVFDEFWQQPSTAPETRIAPTDALSIIYTSGTTGQPKGVLLSHTNYDYDSDTFAEACQATELDRLLCILPLFHVNAQVASMLCSLRCGASLVLLEGFSPREFLPALARYKVSSFSGVPTVYSILNNLPDAEAYDLSSLRVCICGAAPMPVEVFNEFERKYKAFLLEGYGLSEGTCVSTLNPLDGRPRKIGSIGVALRGQEIKIVDDQDHEVPVGQIGEIAIRGPNVMQGYYRNEEATRMTLRNGWLHTGDLGRVDDEGYFSITGRKKEMIIRGGENIYPREVEEVLYRHPAVQEAAVVGLPDPIWGEEVAAFLILRTGYKCSPEEVITYCKEHLANYKCPRIVQYVDSFPKTAMGKIQKNRLVESKARDETR